MSYTYTVKKEEDIFGNLPEGEYLFEPYSLKLQTIFPGTEWQEEAIVGLYKVLRPAESMGQVYTENFSINSSKEWVKRLAHNKLSELYRVVGELKIGDQATESHVLFKKFWATVQYKESNSGKKRTELVNKRLYTAVDVTKTMSTPTNLNDEVPF